MNFVLGNTVAPNEKKPNYIFLFQQNSLLVKGVDNVFSIPTTNDILYLENKLTVKFYIGSLNEHSCYTARFPENEETPDNMEFVGLRQVFDKIDAAMLQAAFRAVQIVTWDETHRFCGVCGQATIKKTDEHAKLCPKCGHISYPRLAPAVIVAVTKDDKLLLASNKNFTSGMYSVLAGFVEAGETLEECVKREIREEVGIEVKNIRYFGSQSWPFPNSYMLAFTAEHESGDLRPDENEIGDAQWFGVDEMPKLPGSISISRRLIDWFVEKYRKQ